MLFLGSLRLEIVVSKDLGHCRENWKTSENFLIYLPAELTQWAELYLEGQFIVTNYSCTPIHSVLPPVCFVSSLRINTFNTFWGFFFLIQPSSYSRACNKAGNLLFSCININVLQGKELPSFVRYRSGLSLQISLSFLSHYWFCICCISCEHKWVFSPPVLFFPAKLNEKVDLKKKTEQAFFPISSSQVLIGGHHSNHTHPVDSACSAAG